MSKTPLAPATTRNAATRTAPGLRDIARGAGALVVLLAAVAGMPLLLAITGGSPVPTTLPSLVEIAEALTSPDDGSLFLDALLLAGWVGWAVFTFSVLVEIPAQLRGRAAPKLPALGVSQRAAGALIAAIAVLFVSNVTAPTAATVGGLRIATAAAQEFPDLSPAHPPLSVTPNHRVAASQHTTHRTTPQSRSHPTYRVRRADTLWVIAERCLGAGERFTEIAALNYGIRQHDGRALTNSHWIYPGWVLRLPADARVDAHDRDASTQQANENYTVQPGDTLWNIAETQLGAPTRFDEIAALNNGHPQPGGDALRDPDHIEPGWRLRLPPQGAPSVAEPTPPKAPTPSAGDASAAAEERQPVAATPSPPTATTTPRPDDGGSGASSADSAQPGGDLDLFENGTPAKVGLGLAGITAAALLAALARRRALQQRTRRPGRRIALPDGDTRRAETHLRAANDSDALAELRAALRLLAQGCAHTGRTLPLIAGVQVTTTAIELLLLEDDNDPVAPFTATSHGRWRLERHNPPREIDQTTSGEADDLPFPYPALLTVDASESSTLLIDLETARTLTVLGDPEATRPVLDAWALELAAAPVSETVGVTLVEAAWPRQAMDPARVRLLDDLPIATLAAASRVRHVSGILDSAGVTTVREARSRRVAGDVWDPEVILCRAHSRDDLTVLAALAAATHGGVCLITTTSTPNDDVAPPGWTLSPVGEDLFQLEPLGISVRPPRLEAADVAAVTSLLTTSDDHIGVDMPPPGTGGEADSPDQIEAQPPPPSTAEPQRDRATPPPRILVLGPVEVEVSNGQDPESQRRRKLTEMAAFIALHPGADNHGIDEAVWPTRRVSASTRNSATSRLRRWLGTAPDGEPWLPGVPDRGRYRFRAGVTCDWHEFQAHARRGFAAGPDGLDELAAALALVRGRPFTGTDPAWYTWAEYDAQEMTSAIADVAHALSVARLAAGDPHGARHAAERGLVVDSCSEILVQDALRAAIALGDHDGASEILDTLRRRLVATDPDAQIDDDTIALAMHLTHS